MVDVVRLELTPVLGLNQMPLPIGLHIHIILHLTALLWNYPMDCRHDKAQGFWFVESLL